MKGLRRRNAARFDEAHHINYDGGIEHDCWIRRKRCCVCEALGLRSPLHIEAAHVIARGMGGCNSGWWWLVPLCQNHHQLQGDIQCEGVLESLNVDLVALAKAFTLAHVQELLDGPPRALALLDPTPLF